MGIDIKRVRSISESGVTAKGYRHRTTVPSDVFLALGLKDKDRLRWVLLKDGTVIVEKVRGRKLP